MVVDTGFRSKSLSNQYAFLACTVQLVYVSPKDNKRATIPISTFCGNASAMPPPKMQRKNDHATSRIHAKTASAS